MVRSLIAAFLACLVLQSARAAAPTNKEKGLYFGIYLKETKLGHMFQELDATAKYQGRPVRRLVARSVMNIAMMGSTSTIRTNAVVFMNPKTGATLAEESETEASGRVTSVKATYTERSVSFTATVQGTTKTGTLTLKPGEIFVRDPSDTPGKRPEPGRHFKGKAFSSDTQTLIDMELIVGDKELVVVGGKSVAAYKIQTLGTVPSMAYVDERGELLLARVALGIEIRRMPREQALATGGKALDLAEAIGVRPTGVSLEQLARTSQSAIYELGSVTRSLPPNNSVQTSEELPAPIGESNLRNDKTLRVRVHATALPVGPTARTFATPAAAPEALRPFLKASEYVPCDDPSFVALARKVIGSEKDAAKIAALLATHTHKTIRPDTSIAAVRTAHDIRKDPRGVCRDYTTYFATLARAVGLPTKQCTGLAYANGLFLYHAWPEVWIGTDSKGADRWVALEPTWGAPYADATHLKLTEGEINDVLNIAADMEHYTIKVIEVKE